MRYSGTRRRFPSQSRAGFECMWVCNCCSSCLSPKARTALRFPLDFVPSSEPARAFCPCRIHGDVGCDSFSTSRERKPARALKLCGPLEYREWWRLRDLDFFDTPRDLQPVRALRSYGARESAGLGSLQKRMGSHRRRLWLIYTRNFSTSSQHQHAHIVTIELCNYTDRLQLCPRTDKVTIS